MHVMTSMAGVPSAVAANDGAVGMRLANCGASVLPGWQLGWSQVIGSHHAQRCEDSVAHDCRPRGDVSGGTALCLAVADGVGGGARGDVASAALASHCAALPSELLGHADGIAQWITLAEAQVQLKLREVSFAPGAATLAAAWLLPPAAGGGLHVHGHVLRVGDARLYRFNGQALLPLTADQTYASVGETPPEGAQPDDPARMVGTGFTGRPEVLPLRLAPGETLLLCSDGLHRGLAADQMAHLLRQGGDLGDSALRLARAARCEGSHDDITVLLARVAPLPQAPQQEHGGFGAWLHRLLGRGPH